jgi:hypothetical protein
LGTEKSVPVFAATVEEQSVPTFLPQVRPTSVRAFNSGDIMKIRNFIVAALGVVIFGYAAGAQHSLPSTFKARTVTSPEGADIFVRSGGSGPVVVLLHGYCRNQRLLGSAGC